MFKKEKTIRILEIGKSYLKLAVVKEDYNKNRTIAKLFKRDLTDKDNISEIINQQGLDFDDLIIILSRDQLTVRNLELPTTDPQEIKDIISIQAGKQTPFSRDEIVTDFQTIGSNRSHYTKVLLAIVQKVIVNSYLNNLAEKKDAVQKIVLGSECLANWYSVIKREIKDETFAIFDLNADFCDFSVFSKEKLLFTRLLPFGISDLQEESWRESFLEEIKVSFDAYKKENIGPAFNKVILMGTAPIRSKTSNGASKFDKDLKDILAEHFSLEAFRVPDELEGITISREAESTLDEEKKEGVSFSKLIGSALDPARPLMDFLPLGLKRARSARIKRKELMLAGILILSVLIMGLGIFLEKIYTKTLLLRRMDAQFVKLEDGTSELKKEYLKINLIKNRMDTKNSALGVLREIHKVVPQEIYLTNISFEEGKLISLRGTSKAMSEVFKFVKTLKGLPNFRNVKTKYATKRKLEGKDLTDFEIICPLVRE